MPKYEYLGKREIYKRVQALGYGVVNGCES